MKKAIFDIGTNSVKVYVFEINKENNNSKKNIYKKKYETEFGKYLNSENFIEEKYFDILINTLKEIIRDISKYDLNSIICFGTEIFRKMKNANSLIEKIKVETNLGIKILSQQEELEYYYLGLVSDFDDNYKGKIAAIDIGGGSIQFMYGTKEKLEKSYKLKTGVLFLRNNYIKNNPPLKKEYENIIKEINSEIEKIDITFDENTPFIHGSTSVKDFFVEANLDLENFKYSKSNPYKISIEKLKEFYEKLSKSTLEEKEKYFPSQPKFTKCAELGLLHIILIAKKTELKYDIPTNNSLIHGFL